MAIGRPQPVQITWHRYRVSVGRVRL